MKTLLVALLLSTTPALAAPQLVAALPQQHEQVTFIEGNRITLQFSEPIDLSKSSVTVTDNEGFVLSTGLQMRGKLLDVTMKARAVQGYLPGDYSVRWKAVSGSGEALGEFHFHMTHHH